MNEELKPIVATLDMERLARSIAEVKDVIKFVGVVVHPAEPEKPDVASS